MAKKAAAKKGPSFICPNCKKDFGSGRGLGKHYKDSPPCRPDGWIDPANRRKGSGKKESASLPIEQEQSATDCFKAGIKKLRAEIAEKESLFASFDEIKKEIESKKKTLAKFESLLPPETETEA